MSTPQKRTFFSGLFSGLTALATLVAAFFVVAGFLTATRHDEASYREGGTFLGILGGVMLLALAYNAWKKSR